MPELSLGQQSRDNRDNSKKGDNEEAAKSSDVTPDKSFGITPELTRTLCLFLLFPLGVAFAGSGHWWAWPLTFLGQLMVALCFCELAARHPTAGSVHHWSTVLGGPRTGRLAGWAASAAAVFALAAAALAYQIALPPISDFFQFAGNGTGRTDAAENAVLLGSVLILFTTLVHAFGAGLMSRVSSAGVVVELVAALTLVGLLAAYLTHGPGATTRTDGFDVGQSLGHAGALLTAALAAAYLLYGSGTASASDEQPHNSRTAPSTPRAILRPLVAVFLTGGLVLLYALLSVPELRSMRLSEGGLRFVVLSPLGPDIGEIVLWCVIIAVTLCALAVHAAAIRLTVALARDTALPASAHLARISPRSGTPVIATVVTGLLAVVILAVNAQQPRIFPVLSSIAVIVIQLACLLVTVPLLVRRLRGARQPAAGRSPGEGRSPGDEAFSLGRFGLPVNLLAVLWGLGMTVNLAWPRSEVYDAVPPFHWYLRWGGVLFVGVAVACGSTYYWLVRREHADAPTAAAPPTDGGAPAVPHPASGPPRPQRPVRTVPVPTVESAASGSGRRDNREATDMTCYAAPGSEGAIVSYASRYDHWIGGEYVPPAHGQYFENPSPVNGRAFTEMARGTADDVERALDAAHGAAPGWARTPVSERANVLNRIAHRMEEHLEELAVAESWENGKPVRETLAADIPLAIDHFRYFAGALRAQEGSLSQLDEDTVAYHFHEPLGVVAQIIPWNFPILMATWKLAPALAAGNTVVLKPAEQTPASVHLWMGLIADLLPPGVVNIVNGFGTEAGKPLASSPRVAKIAFTGETATGRLIMQYASENLKPVTLELGGKSPNLFFDDVWAADDDFRDKALEGFTMFALNQGEVCTCPSRALIQDGHYSEFLEAGVARTEAIVAGNPLDTETMIGAQVSNGQLEKILSYLDIGQQEGAKTLTGGERIEYDGELAGGYYVQPTIFQGNNRMRIFQEEIFGPVLAVTSFSDFDDAVKTANDTSYGLGAGVWTRDMNTAYRAGRAIQAGRVWTNCYHTYPAHAAFGGYKQSGIGRETHRMMLDHYQQTKNLLVSYSPKKLGFF